MNAPPILTPRTKQGIRPLRELDLGRLCLARRCGIGRSDRLRVVSLLPQSHVARHGRPVRAIEQSRDQGRDHHPRDERIKCHHGYRRSPSPYPGVRARADRSPPQLATVLFGVFRDANWHAILQLTLAKFLALSLLIALNARTLLADLLGVDPGIFQSSAKRALPAAAGQTTTTRSKFSSVLLRSGPYGQAAEAAGFDGRPPKSPGPSAVFSPSAMVRDADGRAFPVKASGLGARGRDGNISDLDDLEDDLDDEKDEFGASSRGSYPVQSVAFEDQIEQSSAHSRCALPNLALAAASADTSAATSRTPFVRSESDIVTPPHPYALAS